jgi:hypothetical protein
MKSFFYSNTSLKTISLFHTDSVTNIDTAFSGCSAVEGGALALYNQMSTQASVPNSHTRTFFNCGGNTVTGQAELAQIPTSWGGTMA